MSKTIALSVWLITAAVCLKLVWVLSAPWSWSPKLPIENRGALFFSDGAKHTALDNRAWGPLRVNAFFQCEKDRVRGYVLVRPREISDVVAVVCSDEADGYSCFFTGNEVAGCIPYKPGTAFTVHGDGINAFKPWSQMVKPDGLVDVQ